MHLKTERLKEENHRDETLEGVWCSFKKINLLNDKIYEWDRWRVFLEYQIH